MKAGHCNEIFNKAIRDYHELDTVDQPCENPYPDSTLEHLLYRKNWIDTVQWHYEDLIRDPDIKAEQGMALKRLIDESNQMRTDLVEQIDDYFLSQFQNIEVKPGAGLNTESPAWVIDRLSILALKIFHMREQVERKDVSQDHVQLHQKKLATLLEQQNDLSMSFDQLLNAYQQGTKVMKVYRQMKLYNDPDTNPVLYGKKN